MAVLRHALGGRTAGASESSARLLSGCPPGKQNDLEAHSRGGDLVQDLQRAPLLALRKLVAPLRNSSSAQVSPRGYTDRNRAPNFLDGELPVFIYFPRRRE
jgi:hypothetical protein